MTTLSLYGGPLKRSIIIRAYGMCGQSITEFELSPEELSLGLVCMNDIAATLGTFPYNYPAYGEGNAADESGVPAADVLGFTTRLGQEIAQNIGKPFMPTGSQATAMSRLLSKYQAIPQMEMGRQTPRGAGNRYWNGPLPFFTTDVSSDEPAQ